MNVLKLFPLLERFREDIQRGELSLEESVRNMSYAADLVVAKLEFLLPAQPGEAAEDSAVDSEFADDGDFDVAAGDPAIMDEPEVEAAVARLTGMFDASSRMHSRGLAGFRGGLQNVSVVTVDLRELADALLTAQDRTAPVQRTMVVPRRNFVAHLRGFWREVNRFAREGVVLRFSRFLGRSTTETILNFLSFLELIKRRRLFARQVAAFEDIYFSTRKDEVSDMSAATRVEQGEIGAGPDR